LQSIRNFASDGKISIVRTLDVDIKASRIGLFCGDGKFFIYLFFPAKYQ
jgi:hypothetical protein